MKTVFLTASILGFLAFVLMINTTQIKMNDNGFSITPYYVMQPNPHLQAHYQPNEVQAAQKTMQTVLVKPEGDANQPIHKIVKPQQADHIVDKSEAILQDKSHLVTEKMRTALEKVKPNGTVHGIDISRYQGDEIQHINKQKDHLVFIISKATQGTSYVDPKFKHNWQIAHQKGFIRGAYHFYQAKDSPEEQAKHFIKVLADLRKDDLPPIVDVEEGGLDASLSVHDVQNNLITFLNEVTEQTGRLPIIYTDNNVGNKYLAHKVFRHYPLWIANYRKAKKPTVPSAWKDAGWLLWQRSDTYSIESTKNDYDIFNGSVEQFINFIHCS